MPTNQLSLAIGINVPNPAALNEFVAELADPASPHFRQFLTPAQFAEQFGPSAHDYAVVEEFARTNGLVIRATPVSRLVLDVTGSAAAIEKAFHVTLRTYRHPTENRNFFAPDTEPMVAANLPIADVSGLESFSRPHPRLHPRPMNALGTAALDGSGPGGNYMGNDFRAAYVPGTTLNGAGQTVGLVQFDGFYSNDIASYRSQAGIPNIPLKTLLIDGFSGAPTTGANTGNPEVSLDIEMAMSMAPGLAAIVVFEGNPNNFIPNDVLTEMAASNTIKNLSSSWGWSGGPSTTTDNIFLQMAAQGQTYFSAVGDSDAFPSGYVDNAGNISQPASSPYITQVGGTTLSTSSAGGPYSAETVWNWGYDTNASAYVGTSGGISTYYSIPPWQMGVNSFSINGGSTTHRNVPDVALTADDVYVVYGNGSQGEFGGTSCAAPLWAGFMALVNQQAVMNSRPVVGFLNPMIYELANESIYNSVFHDVTTGDNTWPSSPNAFYAVPGYDLCTGLGTPAGTNLINALVHPDPLIVVSNFGFTATESVNGIFNVSSQNFYLTNASTAPLTWSLVNTSGWLNVSPAGDTLAAGASETVSVSLNSVAQSLTAGNHGTFLWFSNVITSIGHARMFTVNVSGPLMILPTNNFFFTGTAGGPFTPATQAMTLTNQGSYPVTWALGNTSTWFNVSPAGGTLAAHGQSAVTFTSTPAINYLAGGMNPCVLNVTDLTDQVVGFVTNMVNVQPVVQNGGFETGDFTGWTLNGDPSPDDYVDNGSIGISPHSGSYDALFGEPGKQAYLSQTLSTVGNQKYLLSLWVYNPLSTTISTIGKHHTNDPNEFSVSWNGQTLYDQANLLAFPWTNMQFLVTATAANTVLKIGGRDDKAFLGLDDVNVTPASVPLFLTQPANKTVLVGVTVAFPASVYGTGPFAYQWYKNGASLSDEGEVSGTATGTLVLSGVTTNDAGNYSLMVTNIVSVSTSSVAVLKVLPPPAIQVGTTNAGAGFSFNFSGPPSGNYILEATTNLDSPWQPIATNAFGTNGLAQFTDIQATNFRGRFYRVEMAP